MRSAVAFQGEANETAVPVRAAEVDLLGIRISAVNMEQALARTIALVEAGGRGYISVTGVHGIMEAQRDPELKRILNEGFLAVPDGMPTVWLGQLYGHTSMGRVYGPDFTLALCDRSRARGLRHFLYGGQPGVAELLRQELIHRYPGVQIAGTYTPPFRPLNEAELLELQAQVAAAAPDILWVGLSTPKQEKFMHRMLADLEVKVMVGVGAAFDIHTGRILDAPDWMKRAGLQWLHRLLQEPRRLACRYLVNNPLFVWKICAQLLRDVLEGRLRS